MRPRILILTSNSYRQVFFTNEISKHYEVVGIVVEQKFSKGNRIHKFLRSINYNPLKFLLKIYYKIRLSKIDRRYVDAEINMLLGGDRFKSFPRGPVILTTDDINSRAVFGFIRKMQPNIILVSGTTLVRKNIIELAPPKGIVNMHTGLSPYYRGGPCTFWCLFNAQLEYIGVTIHYLTTGIDSGDIILSERETLIEPTDNEATLDSKVITRGAGLMIRAIELIFDGSAPRVPQWTKGRNYLHKYFTADNRLELESKLRRGLVKNWLSKNRGNSFEGVKEIRP